MNTRCYLSILLLMSLAVSLNAGTWYSEYDAALKAVAAKDWAAAQTKLNECMKLQPQQGRRVFAYGVRFIRYIPQYYLGVIAFHQARYEQALNHFQQMQKAGLVAAGDPEYSEMAGLQQLASERLKPKVETPTPAATSPAPVFEEPHAQPPAVENSNSIAETQPPVPATQTPVPAETEESPKQVQDLEDRALLAFFSGDYSRAAQLFQRVIALKNDLAEAWFYLGCSHASLGLLQGKQGDALLHKARQEFARAHKLDRQLKYIPDLISPRIVEIYKQTE